MPIICSIQIYLCLCLEIHHFGHTHIYKYKFKRYYECKCWNLYNPKDPEARVDLQVYIIIEAYVNVCCFSESCPVCHFPLQLQLVSSLSLSIQLWYYITDYWPVLRRPFCLDVIPFTELIVNAIRCWFVDFCQKNPFCHKAAFLTQFSAGLFST